MTFPNFLVIGAAKSGTSSLFRYLGQHPQIYTPPRKEPGFFAFEGQPVCFAGPGDERRNRLAVTDLPSYQALFKGVTTQKAYGEASVVYLYSPTAPDRIKFYVPEVKLIALLRNPVERAFSSFSHLIRDGREPLPNFADALQAEEARMRANWQYLWHYQHLGFYYAQLSRYVERFPRAQLAVYTFDQFSTDPLGTLREIFHFLDVDSSFAPDISRRLNRSGMPKSKQLHRYLMRPRLNRSLLRRSLPPALRRWVYDTVMQWNITSSAKLEFPEETRRYLIDLYREDILELQTLIQKDLSRWLVGQEARPVSQQ